MLKNRAHSTRFITVILLSALLLSACTDPDLMNVAKALDDTQAAMRVFETTVIQANASQLLSDDVTRTLLTAAEKVDSAGQQSVVITRSLSSLAPADRSSLLAILVPVINALNAAQIDITVGIKDPQTQIDVRAALLVIQTSLNTLQLILASKGN